MPSLRFPLAVGFLSSLLVTSSFAADLVRTTADGKWGADTFVQGGTKAINYGRQSTLIAKNQGAQRKIYLRFDLQDVPVSRVTRARFSLTTSGLELDISDVERGAIFRVYGLNDGTLAGPTRLGEDWLEGDKVGKPGGPEEIIFSNAPAHAHDESSISTGAKTADGGQARLLGTFALNDLIGPVGKSFVALDSEKVPALLDFIRADTDGRVTLILTRQTGHSGTNVVFFAKENKLRMAPPSLTLTLPDPVTP